MPIGTVLWRTIASRQASRSPPVDRSMTVSAPQRSAQCSFSTSSSVLDETGEAPMLALILVFAARPMPSDPGGSRGAPCWPGSPCGPRPPRRGPARLSDAARAPRRGAFAESRFPVGRLRVVCWARNRREEPLAETSHPPGGKPPRPVPNQIRCKASRRSLTPQCSSPPGGNPRRSVPATAACRAYRARKTSGHLLRPAE